MTIEIISGIGPARIDIAYERLGPAGGPPVVLIMGLGAQLIGWPDGLCEAMTSRGLQVVRFDNRDAGQSTHMRDAPMPNFMGALAGDYSSASYTLSDLAADTVGLITALGLDSAHIVGASMGGQIAQTIAIEHPRTVRSLTSIMSTTGAMSVGQPTPATLAAMMGPPPQNRQEVIDRALAVFRVAGSRGLGVDLEETAERVGKAYDRAFEPMAMQRQAVATLASGDRTPRLRSVTAPTLVIHGTADQLVDISGGRATAAAIPGAELVEIQDMGHDMPRGVWPLLAERITEHVQRVEQMTR